MRSMPALLTVGVALAVAPTAALAVGPPPWAGPAGGLVPARDDIGAARTAGTPKARPLSYHGGRVLLGSTPVVPVTWGAVDPGTIGWMSTLYGGVGNTPYLRTNAEYWQGTATSPTYVGMGVTAGAPVAATTTPPSGAPSTSQVLSAVVSAVGAGNLVNDAYYPVYSTIRRGTAGYCAWHSYGTVSTPSGSKQVTFGFFFDLAGDAGCSSGATTPGSQAVANLANVSGHELSEVLTDPYLNAWYDTQGAENSDKCAWNFGPAVAIAGSQWRIQKNWSNAAGGCIQTS